MIADRAATMTGVRAGLSDEARSNPTLQLGWHYPCILAIRDPFKHVPVPGYARHVPSGE